MLYNSNYLMLVFVLVYYNHHLAVYVINAFFFSFNSISNRNYHHKFVPGTNQY